MGGEDKSVEAGMKYLCWSRQQRISDFHGKSGSAGEQGEMGDKPEFFKRLSLLLMSLKL